MSAQVTITQLPAAGAITGTEAVPIVQNGQTVQTTTAALAGSPVQTQTFLTLNQEPTLANSRSLSNGTGVGLVDGGAQSTLQITLNAASGSLEAASNGMIAKTASNAVVARTMTSSTTGLSVTNGDGVAGAPAFALTGVALAVAGATGTGALALTSPTTVSTRQILGTASQIAVTDGNFVNSPVIAIASDPILSGSGGLVVPVGTTGQRGSSTNGNLRYNTTTATFEGYANNVWGSITTGTGVTSVATGTGLTGGTITSTGTISIANTAVTAGTYGSSTNVGQFTVNAQGQLTFAGDVAISASSIGAVTSVSGTANEITATGTTSVILSLPAALTFTGKTVTDGTFNMVAATVGGATVVTTTGTQTLTNKTISGASNTLTNIANASLTNSSVTVGTTAIALGASSLTLGGLTSVAVTQDPTSALQLATKQYVDAVAEGLHVHASCAAATPATLASITGGTVTYNNGTAGVGATLTLSNALSVLDGYTLLNGDRVLVKNEATQANNGIYTWATGGTVLTRATDFDTAIEIASGDFTFVTYGTLYASTGWVQTNPVTTVGTDSIVWSQFTGVGAYTAGTGLTLTGTQFSITNTAVTAASYGSATQVGTFTVNAQGQLTSASSTSIAINGNQITSGTVAIANGGTGQTTAGAAFNALSPITTTGDLILGTGVNTASRLPIGANGYLLSSDGTTASWQPAPAGGVTTFSAGTTGLTPATATGGAVTLAGTLAVLNGGTGATNATDARTNLVAAKSGTNSDITELYALNGTSYGVAYQNAGNQLTMGSALTFNGSMLFVPGGISGGTF